MIGNVVVVGVCVVVVVDIGLIVTIIGMDSCGGAAAGSGNDSCWCGHEGHNFFVIDMAVVVVICIITSVGMV